jgi:hypothetical protein
MSDYAPGKVGDFTMVRGFGSGAIHLTIQNQWVEVVAFSATCLGSIAPVSTLCATVIGRGRGVVVMQEGTKINCPRCKRIAARIAPNG